MKTATTIFMSFVLSLINCQKLQMLSSDFATEPISNDNEQGNLRKQPNFGDLMIFLGDTATNTTTPSTWDNLFSSLLKVTNEWSRLVEAFKTVRSEEVKQIITGKGFEYFNEKAQIQIAKGVKGSYIDTFLSHVEERLLVPPERQKTLSDIMEECKYVEKNVWTAFNTLFDINTGGDTKFASLLIARNEENDTYDVVISDIQAQFKLASDIMIVNKKLSVLGGIWQDSKDVQVKVPKTLTQEDITAVMSFFNIVAFKSFADQFGIHLDLPTF